MTKVSPNYSRLTFCSTSLKRCVMNWGMKPGSAEVPVMVWVLPDPV